MPIKQRYPHFSYVKEYHGEKIILGKMRKMVVTYRVYDDFFSWKSPKFWVMLKCDFSRFDFCFVFRLNSFPLFKSNYKIPKVTKNVNGFYFKFLISQRIKKSSTFSFLVIGYF